MTWDLGFSFLRSNISSVLGLERIPEVYVDFRACYSLVCLWGYEMKWNDTLHVSLGLAKGLEEIERTFERLYY
jgi:hypothetical protein